jgi:hypothetical protein
VGVGGAWGSSTAHRTHAAVAFAVDVDPQ